MKHKQNYLVGASFFLVIFMMLGYLVKFFPETLAGIDSNIQTSVRGDLPANATAFFKIVTNFGHEVFIFVYVFAIAFVFYFWKKWKAEAILLAGNLVLMGIFQQVLNTFIIVRVQVFSTSFQNQWDRHFRVGMLRRPWLLL